MNSEISFGYQIWSMKLPLWRIRRESKGKHNKKLQFIGHKLQRIASVTAMAVVMPLSMTPVVIGNDYGNQAQNEEFVPISYTIDQSSPKVISAPATISTIVPGESQIERENRIKAEEKARAEAANKARLEAEARNRATLARSGRSYTKSDFQEIYQRAEAAYGVDARLLQAIHYVETGQSTSTAKTSFAGAKGPMQFMPSTFRRVGVDGNGDGLADITNVEDSIFSAAKYLKLCGYPNLTKALWGYNPSRSYYRKVMSVAASLGLNQ